ncbi:carboxypeptidase-like regulatory domain-containing protein [Hymenobacter fodinae]|uniref:Carboxypeptidase-like regulatory domain-containing protein n=1 Tax=Hymenobacter fodinae TaxID=2510796 RepID=A0A4Z0P6H2_9BACT|nr:carboxypeptidase-like regulatory domain-containing protein [Hymenobacter fodinae]TGE08003.1 carboxypeptidase-like regulatory domain-containing protein [Hymenobacter fodinae]
MKHLLLFIFSLTHLSAVAQQAQVAGRVLDGDTGVGLPGVTILLQNTTIGISSTDEGYFTLPAATDSVTLLISYIGYTSQQLRVAAGSTSTIRLRPDSREFCDLSVVRWPKMELRLASGVRYAPLGGSIRVFSPRRFSKSLAATVGYQTNLSRNHALTAGLRLPSLMNSNRLSIEENVAYEQLRATEAGISFRSYLFTVAVGPQGYNRRIPVLLLGGGHARYRPLPGSHETAEQVGTGYCMGLRHEFLPYPYQLFASVQATRWPGYWQWQGRLAHPLPFSLQAGLEINSLRTYTEVALTLSRFFY